MVELSDAMAKVKTTVEGDKSGLEGVQFAVLLPVFPAGSDLL